MTRYACLRTARPLLLGALLATCTLPGLAAAANQQDPAEAAARESALEHLRQANEHLDNLHQEPAAQPTEPASRESALDRLRQSNESLDELRRERGQSAPQPDQDTDQGVSLPPAQIAITGNTFTIKSPQLLQDVVTDVRGLFKTRRQCDVIDGIHTIEHSAEGPFNANEAGEVISGIRVEQWDVTACGQTTPMVIGFEFQPDATVRYEIMADL